MKALTLLSELGFGNTRKVSGRNSITEIIRGNDKCGVFVLHFIVNADNHEYYIGMSEDIPKRYQQIRADNDDIEYISFKQVKKTFQENEKLRVIAAFEKQFTIRNIAQASRPATESQLDIHISQSEQSVWLSSITPAVDKSKRQVNNTLREKYSRRFSKLNDNPYFHSHVLPVLQKYVSRCIPEPYRTEISFWGCSCLPDSHPDTENFEVYSRIDLFWQEVFTIGQDLKEKYPVYSWHLKKSKIKNLSDYGRNEEFSEIETYDCDDHHYPKGGSDQFNVWVNSLDDALAILDIPIFLESIKEFNLYNMRRGAQVYAPNHCMDLADLILR